MLYVNDNQRTLGIISKEIEKGDTLGGSHNISLTLLIMFYILS